MSDDDTTWNDNLREGTFHRKTQASPVFNQLFTSLWDRVLCSITKMSTFASDICRTLTDIFNDVIPAIDCADQADVNTEEKHIVSPNLIAYLKWLIYTVAFKDPFAEPLGAIHTQFYLSWVDTLAGKEEINILQVADGAAEYLVYQFPKRQEVWPFHVCRQHSTATRRRSAPLDDR